MRWLKNETFLNSSVGLGNTETDRELVRVEQMEALFIKSKRYDEFNDVYWKLCNKSKTGIDL